MGEELRRGEARTGLKDGEVCLRLLISTVALGLLELVCLEEIFWQLLKIPACRDPPTLQEGGPFKHWLPSIDAQN